MLKVNTESSENIRTVDIRHASERQPRLAARLKRLGMILKENWLKISRATLNLFFAYVRGRSNAAKKLGLLVNSEGEVIDSSEGVSDLFNDAFDKVFTKERLGDVS